MPKKDKMNPMIAIHMLLFSKETDIKNLSMINRQYKQLPARPYSQEHHYLRYDQVY